MTERQSAEWASNLERIVAFLNSIGLPTSEGPVPDSALLPGVAIVRGCIVFDRSLLKWPGDLLHEAGHIAVTPAAARPKLDGTLGDDPLIPHVGEVEATAWAYAAVVAIGLAPEVLFHEGGYQGRSAGLAFTYTAGVYAGAAGLSASGLALNATEAARQGVMPYPNLIRWLRA